MLAALGGSWIGQVWGATTLPAVLTGPAWMWLGRGLSLLSGLATCLVAWQAVRPRLAYADGKLLIYLRATAPVRVPLEVVECFLLGQGATLLEDHHLPSRTVTLVIRLAEKRTEWSHIEVHRLLGAWCGSQITIRGTWCEPLSISVVNRLNEQLAVAQQSLSTAQTQVTAS